MMDQQQIDHFQMQGYVNVPGLFSSEEVQRYIDHYMKMRMEQNANDDKVADNMRSRNSSDPLHQYSRLMHPHRHDQLSLDWMLDPRIGDTLTALLGKTPYAVQTMVYFKPAGARGQALHQDQFYLRAQPGTCVAAWMALDDCDVENGCIEIVPGTQNIPILCSVDADHTTSFTDDTVLLPEGMTPVPVIMKAGDVLFFNGQLVHGSSPNITKDRFRRSLIGHYIEADAQQIARWYKPVLRFDGTEVELHDSEWGGRCGVWVDQEGKPEVELTGTETRQNYTIH